MELFPQAEKNMLIDETWKPVVGWEDFYEVSDLGRVRSLTRTVHNGRGEYFISERIVEGCRDSKGYVKILLKRRNRRRQTYVHNLVLEAFVGPRPEGAECRHFPDKCPWNNSLENLSWGTSKENKADMTVHDTDPRGERNGRAKLTEQEVAEIRLKYTAKRITQTHLAQEYGISQQVVSGIVNLNKWKHVG